jgi:hypothetical protein
MFQFYEMVYRQSDTCHGTLPLELVTVTPIHARINGRSDTDNFELHIRA